MSKTVDERVVSMRFDNAQFERGAKQTMDTLNQLEKSLSLEGAKKGIQEAERSINRFNFDSISSQIDSLRLKFNWRDIIGVAALTNIANDVVNTFKNMVNSISIAPIKQGFDEYELKMGAVQTMLASTGASLETVNGYLEDLNRYADKTIYSFSDMTQNIGKFTNNGVKLKDAVAAIQGISNAAAVAGANSNEASRAMYNFSQALSQGSVKLIDWKSIQNANMATVDFKQNLIDTAVALGTVKKQGDQYVTTTTDMNGKISDAFDANKMFNESLAHSWMTTEVLVQTLQNYSTDVREMTDAELESYKKKLKTIGYTEEQIKKIVELSEKANKAATEVKTFHQMMDTLAEGVGSGWSQTFEIIFGDFNESKKLWTAINDVIGGFINETSDARNNMLEAWDAFGGRTELIKALTDAFNNVVSVVETINTAFREIFPKDLSVKTKGVAGAFKEVSGGAKILVEATQGLSKAIKELTPSEETLDKISRTFKGIFAILDVGRKIVVSVFKAIKPNTSMILDAGSNILDITARIGDALVNFDKGFDPNKSFGKILNGIKIVIDEFQLLLYNVTNFASDLEVAGKDLGGLFDTIFTTFFISPLQTVVRIIGRLLGKTGDDLNKFVDNITRPLFAIRNAVTDFIRSFKPLNNLNFKMPDLSGFKEFADTIIDRMNPLQTAWNILKSIGKGISNVLSGIAKAFGPIAQSLGGAVKSLFDMIARYFQNASFNEILDVVNSGVLILLGNQLTGLVKDFRGIASGGFNLKNLTESFINPIKQIAEVAKDPQKLFGGIKDGFKGLFSTLTGSDAPQPDVLKTIAESIMMLAGSLFVLALIPSDKLAVSMAAITGLFVDLMKSLEFLEKNLGGGKKTLAISASILIISGAMMEMAIALQIMSAMSWERIAKGLTNFGVSMGIIVASFRAIKGDELVKTAGAIWIVSKAMISLGIAMQILSAMSWERTAKAFVNLASSMAGMIAAFKLIKGEDLIKTAGAIWIVSNAMIQMGAAMQIMGAMSWAQVAKSIIVFATSIGIMIAAFKLIKGEDLIKTSGAIWIFGQAMIGIATAMQIMGAMSWSRMAKSIIVFATSMTIIVNAFNDIDNKEIIKIAGAMWILGQAMIGMGAALQIMGSMKLGGIVKSLLAFGGTIAILTVAINKINALDAVKIAGSLVLISVALTSLAVAMGLFGLIGIDSVLISLGALAGTLIVLGTAAAILDKTGLDAAIVHLGIAMAAAGAGMILMGLGLASVATGLIALSMVGTAAIANILASIEMLVVGGLKILTHSIDAIAELIVGIVGSVLKTIKGIIPDVVEVFLLVVDETLASIANHGPEILRNLIAIISDLFNQLIAYTPTFITQVTDFIIAIVDGLAANLPKILVSIMNFLGSLIQGAIDALNDIDRDTLVNGILLIGMIEALMISLSSFAILAIPAAAGVLAFGGIITELGAVLAALGALNQIPGLNWLIGEGGELLNSIGSAIGRFVGGIGEGISDSFPKIATNLTMFMNNATGFIEGAKKIDSSVLDGVKALVDAMLMVTGASVVDAIASFLIGDTDFQSFGEKIKMFGESIASFGKSVEGVNADQVKGCAEATKVLVEMAREIPNEGGLVALITGDNSLQQFGLELASYGPKLKVFADSVKGINIEEIEGAAEATNLLTDMASRIPNKGGIVAMITGDNSLQQFGLELASYGPKLKAFSDSIKGIRTRAIQSAVDITNLLTDMASRIPNTGGLVACITGDNSLGDFGHELSVYGLSLKKFAKNVKGIMSENFTGTIDATRQLIEMASIIPNQGGLVAKITGDNSLSVFGKELASFGPKLAKFSDKVYGVNPNKVTAAARATKILVSMTKDLPKTGGLAQFVTGDAKLSKFGVEIAKFGPNLKKFSDMSKDVTVANVKKLVDATKLIVGIELPKTGGLLQGITGEASLKKFGNQLAAFAPNLEIFAEHSKDIDVETVKKGARAAKAVLGIDMPTEGGIFSWFTGNKSLESFGKQIVPFADSLKEFNSSISNTTFNMTQIQNAADAIVALVGITNKIPAEGGVQAWLKGNKDLGKFGDELSDFSVALPTIAANFSGITKDDVRAVSRASDIIETITTSFGANPLSKSVLQSFSTGLKSLGKALGDFSSNITGLNIESMGNVFDKLKNLADIADKLKVIGDTDISGLLYTLERLGQDVVVSLSNDYAECMSSMVEATEGMTEAINDFRYQFANDKNDIGTNASVMASYIKTLQTNLNTEFDSITTGLSRLASKFRVTFQPGTFETLGKNVPEGIAKGLKAGLEEIESNSDAIAQLIIDTIEKRLEIHSPSKEGMRIGKYFDIGIADGMTDGISNIEKNGELAGDAAVNSLREALRRANELAQEELNTSPVIKPVLDLSEIQNGGSLGSIFSRGIGVSATYKQAQGIIRSGNVNAMPTQAGIDPSQFNQLLDETRLMREEIGNFSNDLSNMKVVMNSGALVGEIGRDMDAYLGGMAMSSGRGII